MGKACKWSTHAMALRPPRLRWWMHLPLLRAKCTVRSASTPMSSSSLPPYLQMPQAHLQLAAEVRTIHTGKHKTQPRCGRSLTSNVKRVSLRIRRGLLSQSPTLSSSRRTSLIILHIQLSRSSKISLLARGASSNGGKFLVGMAAHVGSAAAPSGIPKPPLGTRFFLSIMKRLRSSHIGREVISQLLPLFEEEAT